MASSINKTGLILFTSVLLHSLVGYAHATRENYQKLAEKFAPILVLTENPTPKGRSYRVLNPEPVGIVGAASISNVLVRATTTAAVPYFSGSITSAPQNFRDALPSSVNIAENKFAFLSSPIFFGASLIAGIYFDYPGDDEDSWYDAYFPEDGEDDSHAGSSFGNTVYARVFERPEHSLDGNGAVVIKYFSFFPFNHWANKHEGDWQKINVIVTSTNPDDAQFFGIDYLFHGKSMTYYNITSSVSSINIRKQVAPVDGTHPVAYVSAGGHGHFPTPGHYENAGLSAEVRDKGVGWDEDLTPNGLVLHPEIVDSDETIAQSYDIVLLPEPVDTLDNRGLTPETSWLGARIPWGETGVSSFGSSVIPAPVGNRSPAGPYHTSGWDNIRVDSKNKYSKSRIPRKYRNFHNFPIVGDVTWDGPVSLRGDIVVFPGATLTIKPGTVIEFEPKSDIHQFSPPQAKVDKTRAEIFVYGTLTAEGKSDSLITFRKQSGSTRQGGAYAWGGIRVMEGGSVTLNHAEIRDVPPPRTRPTGLTAQAGDGQATLRWDALSPADPSVKGWQYRTRPKGATKWEDPWEDVSPGTRTTREAVVSDLAHGVRHQFEVRAVNATGGGPASNIASVSLMTVAFNTSSYTLIESGHPVGLAGGGLVGQAEDPTQAGRNVQVIVQLTPKADRRVEIPVTVTVTADAPEAKEDYKEDYEVSNLRSGTVRFGKGETSKGFKIKALSDDDVDDETLTLGFGELPAGVRAGEPASATLTIYDTPSAPAGLTAAGGHEEVRLGWDDPNNAGITGWQYQVRRVARGVGWGEWMNMDGSGATTVSHTVRNLDNGVKYRFKVRAYNTRGIGADSKPVEATPAGSLPPPATNTAPVISGPTEVSYAENGVDTVATYTATDAENHAVDWSVEGLDGVDFSISVQGRLSFGSAPDFERPSDRSGVGASGGDNVYHVTVKARDRGTPPDSSLHPVQVTVTGVNEPPEISGASVVSYAENGVDTVAAYTASDPEGDAVDWSVEGLDAVDFSISVQGRLSFGSAPDFERPSDRSGAGVSGGDNVYHVTVKARDRGTPADSSLHPVQVTVTDVDEAASLTVSYGAAAYRALEGGAAVSVSVGLSPAADRAVDVPIAVTAGAGTEAGDYAVAGLTGGQLSFASGASSQSFTITANVDADVDAETVALGFGPLPAGVSAGTPSSATVTLVDRMSLPGAPGSLTATPGKLSAANKGPVVLTWSTAADHGAALTGYEVRRSADGGATWAAWTEVAGSGAATASDTVRGLSPGAYTFEVRALNEVGEGRSSRRATGAWFAENGSAAVVAYPSAPLRTWSLAGADADSLQIDGSGRLAFRSSPNFEEPGDAGDDNVYAVTVQVRDGGVMQPSAATTVRVRVTNVEEEGTVSLSSTRPRVGIPLRATLMDPDGGAVPRFWFWDKSGGSLSGASGEEEGGPRDTYTPLAGDVGKRLQARVTYTDGHGSDQDEAQSAWTSAVIGVPCAPRNLRGEAGAGQVTLRWSPPACDGGSALSRYDYRQSADGGATWNPKWTSAGLDTARTLTGLINGTTYTFEVRAVNAVGFGDSVRTTATPRDLEISGPPAVSFAENGVDTVAVYTATGVGGTAVAWTLEGTDVGDFTLDGQSGVLKFKAAPDYEAPADAGGNNVYEVRVKAVAGSLVKKKGVQVTVTAVEEAGTVSLSSTRPRVGTRVRATLADPDGGAVPRFWFWDKSGGSLSGASGEEGGGPRDDYTPKAGDVGKRLRARVTYTDGHGSGQDEAQSAWTSAVIGVPCAPRNLRGEAGGGQVTLRWSPPACDGGSALSRYDYRQSADGGATWNPKWTSAGLDTARTLTGLTNGRKYTFEVRAVNAVGSGASVRTTATPRALEISGPSAVSFAENGVDTVAVYTATGVGGTAVAWTLEGTDAGDFTLDGQSGVLKFKAAPDFEAPVDAGGNNVYEVRVKAVAGSLVKKKGVQVTVTGVEEAGAVSLSSTRPRVGTRVRATLADPDGGAVPRFWFWDKSSASLLGASGEEGGGPRDDYTPKAGDVGKRLRARVTYTDGHGSGQDEAQSAWTSAVIGVPCAPRNLRAQAGSGRVTLRWSPPACDGGSALSRYEYRQSADGGATWNPKWTSAGLDTARTLTGLTNGTTHTFEVRAVNGVGDGSAARVSATPAGGPGRPGSLSASRGNGRVTLRWSAASSNGSAITRYEYQRGSSNWSTVSGGASARSKTVTGLSNGTKYTFRVRAVNGVGAGSPATVSATPAGGPGRPGSLSASAGSGRVTLRWSAASSNGSAITRYEYQRGSSRYSTVSGGASARSKTVTGLTNGTKYTFRVRAVNGVGAGSAATVSATPAGVPGAPQNLRASTGIGKVTLSWGAASSNGSAITHYEYKRGNSRYSTVSGGASARRQTVTGLTGGLTYTFYVRAVNGVGAGSPASRSATPIDDFALKSNHPNPFNAETLLHYALPEAQRVRLTIYDMLGRVVRRLVDEDQPPGWHRITWDGRDESGREVASGIYFYRIQTPEFKKTRKMILLR